jgi:hypothetical protein
MSLGLRPEDERWFAKSRINAAISVMARIHRGNDPSGSFQRLDAFIAYLRTKAGRFTLATHVFVFEVVRLPPDPQESTLARDGLVACFRCQEPPY